jgi:hypothetical protein
MRTQFLKFPDWWVHETNVFLNFSEKHCCTYGAISDSLTKHYLKPLADLSHTLSKKQKDPGAVSQITGSQHTHTHKHTHKQCGLVEWKLIAKGPRANSCRC